MSIDTDAWNKELIDQEVLFFNLRDRIPRQLIAERQQLISRL